MRASDKIPILIKLIDAQDNLSVQVHPNDEQARKWENQNGKTEMWYVVQTDKGAKLSAVLKRTSQKKNSKRQLPKVTLCTL